ncbi:Acetyltransferase (GNAT) family protein OS=Ureibacillus acetophenoni OX=614649 GN=SAMN05877842_10974 PE=4 SV=1 [Ureibacillus acetophenoni]
MLQINRNFLTIPTNDIYFENKRGKSRYKAKLSCYTHRLRPSRQLQSKQTIHINLQQNEEMLINNLSTETKGMLFQNNNNAFKLSSHSDPSFEQLREFQRFYNENIHIGMDKLNRSKFQSLLLLRDQGALILTKIENADNEVLSYRIYVVDGENALLLYVSSAISEKDNSYKANLLLCWENMNMFRKLGYSVYDFGGIDREVHLRGSQLFGGSEVTVFSGYIAKSFVSKMIAKVNQWRE